MVGDVEGRVCVLIDDMIDTGGTLVAAAEQLVEKGASAVYAAATHGVFSGPAIDRIKNSVLEKVVITNTLPLPPEKQIDKIEVLIAAAHHRRRDRRGLRGHLGVRDLRRPEPALTAALSPNPGLFRTVLVADSPGYGPRWPPFGCNR